MGHILCSSSGIQANGMCVDSGNSASQGLRTPVRQGTYPALEKEFRIYWSTRYSDGLRPYILSVGWSR